MDEFIEVELQKEMKIAVHQPNFFPWLGYFYKISSVDKFVILDNVDIVSGTSTAITNRTKILSTQGEQWLTVPMQKGESKKIQHIQIVDNQNWRVKHIKTLDQVYRKAPFFESTMSLINGIYSKEDHNLSDLNCRIIKEICDMLNISTPIVIASDLNTESSEKNDRLIEICRKLGATAYLSGNGAKKYNDSEKYADKNIELIYTSFPGVVYQQFNSAAFCNGLSIIDVFMNNSIDQVKSFLNQ